MYSDDFHLNHLSSLKINLMPYIPHPQYDTHLRRIIFQHSDLLQRLSYVRQLHANAYLSAGVIRNLVWSTRHQQTYALNNTEIDVIFFDPHEQAQYITQQLKHKLSAEFPDNDWDVVNQALVHTWYKMENGHAILPYQSLFHALSMWPETATAIAVRLLDNDDLEVIAPFGLHDLFELKLRWNPRLVSYAIFKQRVESKHFLTRWHQLRMISQDIK